jgi:hypothetical protein
MRQAQQRRHEMTGQFPIVTAVAVVGLLAGAARFAGATPQDDHSHAANAAAQPAPQASGQAWGQAMPGMMKMHEQMMADMKKDAGRLDALVKEMNAASGPAKTDAIAAVVTELVQQHGAMQARMRSMHEMMMGDHAMPAKP